jgi:hypothetical protein
MPFRLNFDFSARPINLFYKIDERDAPNVTFAAEICRDDVFTLF